MVYAPGRGPGTNRWFSNYRQSSEQGVLEDLVNESIKTYGIDLYYLPRTLINYDSIYGEDDVSQYNVALPIVMYITSVDGFEGDGVFLSKFGLEIRDQVVFTVARREFEWEVTNTLAAAQPRPNEGDLIYYPLNDKVFQIRFVNYLPVHYPLGALQSWDLTCELFEYSNEELSTGITAIDEIQTKFTTNMLQYAVVDENDDWIVDEDLNYVLYEGYWPAQANVATVGSEAKDIQDEQEEGEFIDFSEIDPFSEGEY